MGVAGGGARDDRASPPSGSTRTRTGWLRPVGHLRNPLGGRARETPSIVRVDGIAREVAFGGSKGKGHTRLEASTDMACCSPRCGVRPTNQDRRRCRRGHWAVPIRQQRLDASILRVARFVRASYTRCTSYPREPWITQVIELKGLSRKTLRLSIKTLNNQCVMDFRLVVFTDVKLDTKVYGGDTTANTTVIIPLPSLTVSLHQPQFRRYSTCIVLPTFSKRLSHAQVRFYRGVLYSLPPAPSVEVQASLLLFLSSIQ